jgi:uncharacterized membrane protein YbhN (UPF0104 family)
MSGRVDASAGTPAARRGTAWIRVGIAAALLALVFAVLLPRMVDYGAMMAALGALTAGQVAVLAAVTGVAYVANAVPYKILVQPVSWPGVVGADIAGRAVASTIPGPMDLVTRLVLYNQWRIPMDAASAGLVLGGLLETVSALVLPLLALAGILLSGSPVEAAGVWLAAIGVLVLAAAAVVFGVLVESEPVARRLGAALDWAARHLYALVHRSPPSGIPEAVLDIRARLRDLSNRRGAAAFGAAVAAKLAWFLVLETALRACGVGPEVLPPATVLAAMAVVSIVALIPLTPGAVGVSEMTYVALFSSAVDPAYAAQVAAAVLLYRVAQWLVPVPLGWSLLLVMRRGHGLFADDM